MPIFRVAITCKEIYEGEAESKEEADKLFNGLSEGGQVEMPIADSPWGSYFGMFRDKYGIEWMVDFDPKYKGQL